ncbi:hypothetical protein ACFFUP_09285 [Vibrio ostreicida]|uniref:Tc toxin complex TcA C-terminal TcB-binding domain-containing protein n=1 Tax=Vibrio ostreicida TaxID=526588 RepID=A0ABT8C071_9VIBR|nr:hypothetical protein [Vibrio ostreicida]MDN3611738.1 hypothetical protein [Vibrio ostreicida]NPD09552.1 hypothetical protein [Vibrio ostreicida]
MNKILALAALAAGSNGALASDWLDINQLPSNLQYPVWIDSPYTSNDSLTRSTSDLYINLKQWIDEQNLYQTKPTKVYIFADTLEVSENFNLVLNNQNIVIFARRIIGTGRPTFVLGQQGAAASITVIAEEMETPFNVIAFNQEGGVTADTIANNEVTGTSVILAGEHYIKQPLTTNIEADTTLAHTQFSDIMNRSFDMATSLYDQKPAVSLKLLSWIEQSLRQAKATVSEDSLLTDLYLQTIAFKQFVELSSRSDRFVPYLDRTLYQDKYQAYLEAMIAFEQKRESVSGSKASVEDKIENARLSLAHVDDVLESQNSIIAQSEQNVTTLLNSLSDVETQYKTQELTALSARSQYLYGVEVWKTKQQLEAALAIFKAVAEIGSAVSGVFTGNLSGINDLTEQLSKTPEALDKAKNLVTNIKNVTGIIDNITKTVTGIGALTQEVKSTIRLQTLSQKVEAFNFALPSLNESNLAWDLMLAEVRSNLRYAQSLKIRGARNYLLELEKQVLLGKAINASQLNLVQEQATQIDLILTRKVTLNQKQRLSQMIDNAAQDNEALKAIEQELARVALHFKRPMFVALSNYIAAYEYWSLKDSDIKPSLNKSYLDYQFDLASIENEYINALNQFHPAPQDFTVDNFVIDDQEQIASLAKTGQLNFKLPLEQTQFCGFDRVRLDTIRIFLEGANLPYGKQFNLSISTGGTYQDRYNGKTFEFSANPLRRAFYYRLDDATNNQVSIITDGALSNKFAYAYFEPTPFTSWNATLNNFDVAEPENNQYLTSVERVRVEFSGNGIPNGGHCSNE